MSVWMFGPFLPLKLTLRGSLRRSAGSLVGKAKKAGSETWSSGWAKLSSGSPTFDDLQILCFAEGQE